MKCEVTSSRTHGVLISKEINYKSYKEICSGEKKRLNIGFNNDPNYIYVENGALTEIPRQKFIFGDWRQMSEDWEVFSKFFAIYNIEPNWMDCGFSWGWYDEDLGGWTGCMGKV